MTENQAFDFFIGQLILDNSTLTQDVLNTITTLYPANDPTAGGPFHTGDSLFDRAESWYTDNMYLAPRRLFFDNAVGKQPLFGYFFKVCLKPDRGRRAARLIDTTGIYTWQRPFAGRSVHAFYLTEARQ